ncbi:AraC family transcriptional regulator [Paenibacillus glycinis]|uniref:Helix-turn-helix domain-containing protein n=1 Tax=Paenibacillus glycinis TaxID=2697035 RepID=A0ABW9XZZ7_9BACL|nr:AraC family transcriptional regulator [Paenibacillus glycinis]NBD28314.1 helix-turn-helix domain-containing protein [Paenibacillus glycinis]
MSENMESRSSATLAWDELQPVVWYANRMQCQPGFAFGPRVIDEHQFILVADGFGTAWIQGERYEAAPGSLFYYGPDTVHHFIADEEKPFLLYGLHFSWTGNYKEAGKGISIREVSFDPSVDAKQDNRYLIVDPEQPEGCLLITDIRTLSIERFEPRFARIAECYGMDESGFKASMLRGLLLELLAAMKQWDRQGNQGQPITPIIGAIAERLASHARERYDHRWLGEWSSYHPDHVARQFRAQLGVTPYDFFMSRKLQLAKDLLAHSELPLLDVADELEVGSIHNFTKWFKQHTGLPPGKFRSRSRFI